VLKIRFGEGQAEVAKQPKLAGNDFTPNAQAYGVRGILKSGWLAKRNCGLSTSFAPSSKEYQKLSLVTL
jgi:hypothetical protein